MLPMVIQNLSALEKRIRMSLATCWDTRATLVNSSLAQVCRVPATCHLVFNEDKAP
ncbi:MAG: hypothetical protein ACLTZB_06560 [Streptococcus salivarius]